ncbi:YbaB/EbfC family DNA-binding protein [Saccharopolyspora sp. NFXS83]|uniref:YbaB/EbfC family DNA-binding protein n=1 Tax=Saccharopolyspora sp. NFXS83 TaxID=2993560 RepID=UPI00224A5ED1|nr:YbaB/EbfC family DNA-binding protein [Saccharopolyspora sp. NFXS83]MCX2732722.1 YbaB/EbfC family DNA-binding protein [Saccharopolyspora sp. NFXS83]
MTTTGRAERDGVRVEVAPGGALRSLVLEPSALRGGGAKLASTITALAREANVDATRAAARDPRLAGLSAADRAALGLEPGEAARRAEEWR